MIKVFIQSESGSCERNLYDEKELTYRETRQLPRPYPYPYGFIPETVASDGGCVDCYVITRLSLKAGAIVECEPVGILEQDEDGEIDHKILAILPGQDLEIDAVFLQRVHEELQVFIQAIFAPFPVRVGDILPGDEATCYIQACQGPQAKRRYN